MARALVLALLSAGCASVQPADVLREYARTLEATKSAYYASCVQVPQTQESEGKCVMADVHLEAAIELYTDLRGD